MKRKHLFVAGALAAAGVALYFLFRASKPGASSPPAVAGTVTSGSASTVIDTNVLSPTFGLAIPATS